MPNVLLINSALSFSQKMYKCNVYAPICNPSCKKTHLEKSQWHFLSHLLVCKEVWGFFKDYDSSILFHFKFNIYLKIIYNTKEKQCMSVPVCKCWESLALCVNVYLLFIQLILKIDSKWSS